MKAFTRSMSSSLKNLLQNNELINNTAFSTFEIRINSHTAKIEYSKTGSVYDLVHTSIPDQYQGHGLGSVLAKRVFDHIAQNNQKMELTCEYLQNFYNKNREQYEAFVVEN